MRGLGPLLGLAVVVAGVVLVARAASASTRAPCATTPDHRRFAGRDDLLAAWQWVAVGGGLTSGPEYQRLVDELERIGATYEARTVAQRARLDGHSSVMADCEAR